MGVIFTPKLGFLTIKFLILIILRPQLLFHWLEQRLLQLIILGTLNNDTSTNEVDKDEEMSKNYSGIQEETIWGNTGNIQVENSKGKCPRYQLCTG